MILGLTREQIRALAAGFVCMLIYGSSYTYGSIVPYIYSYIYYHGNENISLNQMALVLPIAMVGQNLGMPLSNIPQLQFSNRIITLSSVVAVSVAIFTLSYSNQFWQVAMLYALVFCLFIGYGYLAPIKNCYQHIPHKKGLCSGVCILGYGIASLLFNVLIQTMVNPNNEKMTRGLGGKMVYSRQVANNYPFAMRVMSLVYISIGLLGIFLMRPPKIQNTLLAQVKQYQMQKKSPINRDEENSNQSPKKSQSLVSFIIDKKIHFLTLTLACSAPFGTFMAYNYKEYGNTRIDDDSFLTTVGSVGAIFNGFGRLIFGMLFDRFSFKVLSSIINVVLLFFSLTLSILIQSKYMYLIAVSMIYFVYGANYSIYPTQTVRLFGQTIGTKIYYIVYAGISIACIMQYLSRAVLVHQGRKFECFRTCFFVFAGFNVVALLMIIFVKYDYEEDIELQIENERVK